MQYPRDSSRKPNRAWSTDEFVKALDAVEPLEIAILPYPSAPGKP